MSYNNNPQNIFQKRTPGNQSGGFLFDLTFLPPLAVFIIGLVMAWFLSQVKINTAQVPLSHLPVLDDGSQIAPLFTPEIRYWEDKIITWSENWELDPNLVATIMQIESCGNHRARSSVGAVGLFQVMPYHFSENENPYKPNVNARRGLAYLSLALEARGGDTRLGFAGYNGGITGAQQPESGWPAETIRYVYWGTGIYADAVKGSAKSDRLAEWLAAGGASLCENAANQLGIID